MSGEEGRASMFSQKLMHVTDRIVIRTFFKAFGLRQFEKHLPTLTYRKRAKVNRCSQQIQVFAVKMARKELGKMIMDLDDRHQLIDFLYLRADIQAPIDEEFDEGYEFLTQMENKLTYLINEVENARREAK